MKLKLVLALIVFYCLGAAATDIFGQQQNRVASKPAPPIVKAPKSISYQLASWKTKHIHDAAKIAQSLKDLKRIGCEVVQNQHGNHVDIRYRCVAWKTMRLDNDQQVQEWNDWLTKNGMETVVLNPPSNTKLATVRYRLPAWGSAHLHDPKQADAIIGMFKLLGCEVTQHDHNGHVDARFRCEKWTTIGVATDQSAHVWQAWLKNNGFETQHSH